MWLALMLVAITSSGTLFMLRFLLALLRERAPSVCYWVIPSVSDDGQESSSADCEQDVAFELQDYA
jgi:hypothetical protein